MSKRFNSEIRKQLDAILGAGTYKTERVLGSQQSAEVSMADGRDVLIFCSNNYLGLANHPSVIKEAQKALDEWGFGLASVRFICGTQEIHKKLEAKVSKFLGMEDTILYSSCFDANGGVFEPLLGEDSAIISDALNHASIIDGVRLCKAQRYRYAHSNMEELEQNLQDAKSAKFRLIVTDGVFSMDGDIARLPEICDLAEKYDAIVMVDDSHATGYIGATGRGTIEHCNVQGRVDIISTTFGKALGGSSGGCISGSREVIDYLRQRSRPYLFSNTIAPPIVAAVIKILDMLTESTNFRNHLMTNANYFRKGMVEAGFDIIFGDTAIVPVMIYNEALAVQMADKLLKEGVYVIGFTFPVVPVGQARIRVQISAAHSLYHLDRAIQSFVKIGSELKII
ncbi:MAG: glycine C-acetyltransferase [Candidatus Cloacimonadaceae bacterium]|nr:glycine C-acetyltransferase [Candidatus Cloacimonadaceae bacterium]MDP3114315.1 glycine C-acetyltransferase [Candidatus Cloacimonadaceae bacterium]